MRNLNVSVCMATYNGIKYIQEQINSILPQLISGDELIISDDGSSDGTWEYLERLDNESDIVKLVKGPGRGANQNFFSLFRQAKNNVIIISDQDDVWLNNKVETLVQILKNNPKKNVVLHKDIIKYVGSDRTENCISAYHGLLRNLLRNSYSGHRMAFNKEIMSWFIDDIAMCPAYDQYIGLLAEKHNTGIFTDEILDYHLIHDNNVSRPLNIRGKVKIRMQLFKCLLKSK